MLRVYLRLASRLLAGGALAALFFSPWSPYEGAKGRWVGLFLILGAFETAARAAFGRPYAEFVVAHQASNGEVKPWNLPLSVAYMVAWLSLSLMAYSTVLIVLEAIGIFSPEVLPSGWTMAWELALPILPSGFVGLYILFMKFREGDRGLRMLPLGAVGSRPEKSPLREEPLPKRDARADADAEERRQRAAEEARARAEREQRARAEAEANERRKREAEEARAREEARRRADEEARREAEEARVRREREQARAETEARERRQREADEARAREEARRRADEDARRRRDDTAQAGTTDRVAKAFDFYGLPPTAAWSEVEKRYRQRAKEFHPDAQENHGRVAWATRQTADLNAHRDVLRAYFGVGK